jgi:hypothetical protein
MSDKALVYEMLSKLPDEIKLKEIKEEFDLLIALQEGIQQLDAGEGIPHEEMEKKVAAWFGR